MKSVYYVAVNTGKECDAEEYLEHSTKLRLLMEAVLGDEAPLSTFLKGESVTAVHSEIEVNYEECQLVSKAVLEVEATGKVTLDKAKLTSALRGSPANCWGALKIEKRSVPKDFQSVATEATPVA